MKILFSIILTFCVQKLVAQKPFIDSTAYKNWPTLGFPILSNNGRYLMYKVNNSLEGPETLILQATDGKWKKEFKNNTQTALIDKYFLFLKDDSLGILTLGTENIKYTPQVSQFWLHDTSKGECLFYRSKNQPKTLFIKNLKTDKRIQFANVESSKLNGDILVLFKGCPGNNLSQSINLANINTGKITKIWEGGKPENLILDVKHQQLAFKTGDSVWYYKIDSEKVILISDRYSEIIQHGLYLGALGSFSEDGKHLFISLIERRNVKPLQTGVEIWRYTDVVLQSERITETDHQEYIALINITNHKIIRLQQRASERFQFPDSDGLMQPVGLIENREGLEPWNAGYKCNWSLISTMTGERTALNSLDQVRGLKLSPSGKFLIYFDKKQQDYFSYEIATAITRNLTEDLDVSFLNIDFDDVNGGTARGLYSLVWFKNDESVLVYDRYDIWKLDPLNQKKPVNLTNGYGNRNQIVFNIMPTDAKEGLNNNGSIYLTGFNKNNKDNGFFKKQLNKSGNPERLFVGPYIYNTNSAYVPSGSDFSPIKAKKDKTYIVRRMSATDAPNYYSTRDFKSFIMLSNQQPHRKYNWYTTELHTWKSPSGRNLQGILYKPENFDPNRKYPVIFQYYERKSDGLNAYLKPETLCGGCSIDITTYVSSGYLVFTPDIYYEIGNPMQGTYDSVVSAAGYLSALPYVNERKMGIHGCSWGGFQTNYLVTHTKLFAVAVSSSGVADWISVYGSVDGSSQQSFFESGQARVGASFWEKPGVYIKSSPIFQVDKVTTPILIMHTRNDSRCPYVDALAFFTGLRRMGKKAWMLVYPNSDHGVYGKKADDFAIRMMQFFDHYLKDRPAPVWMLDGVSAENRNLKAGLELNEKGRSPGTGLLTPMEQTKVDSLMTSKPITITLK